MPAATAPTIAPASQPLLVVRDLAVSFASDRQRVTAVRGVSMTIYPGQTLGVVGESGCGKSVTAMSLMHLIPRPPGSFDRGTATFQTSDGPRDLLSMTDREIRAIRGGQIAMIFQEPMSSLNPVFTIGDQIVEAIRLHQPSGRVSARELAIKSLDEVGISNPAARLRDYPHQFSGGMRQRVMIAMALACRPRLLLADEPTTALDATVQKQILALLSSLKRSHDMAIMLITHDLGVVAEHADVVCVMYAGRVVEYARTARLLASPMHPYSRALLACAPRIGARRERLSTVPELMRTPGFMSLPLSASIPQSSLTPWWPDSSEPSPAYALREVADEHWVAVASPSELAREPDIPPDLATVGTSDL